MLISVLPGQIANVKKTRAEIGEMTMINAGWGKPDIVVKVEVPHQETLTQLSLTSIHAIEGVAQTDTHLVSTLRNAPSDNGQR